MLMIHFDAGKELQLHESRIRPYLATHDQSVVLVPINQSR